ncbi:hypothetical protein GBA65_20040 [Rubrobacter marinus]|uniref:GGDEF domain-containing protein n=1 Tax=Rubrobacter marinus TaxID=2653852 RepID=A0A6G8Q1T6_9ACTN|nr:hypothetical protein [Rubrobacter marinus]QIN80426.1 hypothetical protein GBA65_20040 [Rubrobacter marinus]
MTGRARGGRSARVLKGLSLLYLFGIGLSLLLVHGDSYNPAVSFVPLYLIVSVLVTAAVALLLLPKGQFGEGFCVFSYALYAVILAAATFFTGGASSELYVLFFPLLFAPALHGTWRMGLPVLVAVLVSYALAMLPDVLDAVEGSGAPALVFFRLAAFALTGVFALAAAGGRGASEPDDGYALDEDGSMLLGTVTSEIEARRGAPVGVLLVDPGHGVEDVDLLMDRVRGRIGEPFLLGEGSVFGVVLGGANEGAVESAARRALAAASSLGAEETRAGAAIYPRDARTAGDLLVAAGQALETAFEIESPSAIVLAGRNVARTEGTGTYGAAR